MALGPEDLFDLCQHYGGGYQTSSTWLDTKEDGTRVYEPNVWSDSMHGKKCIGVWASFNDDIELPKLSDSQITALKTEMRELLEEYTRGWTYTVRAMS